MFKYENCVNQAITGIDDFKDLVEVPYCWSDLILVKVERIHDGRGECERIVSEEMMDYTCAKDAIVDLINKAWSRINHDPASVRVCIVSSSWWFAENSSDCMCTYEFPIYQAK